MFSCLSVCGCRCNCITGFFIEPASGLRGGSRSQVGSHTFVEKLSEKKLVEGCLVQTADKFCKADVRVEDFLDWRTCAAGMPVTLLRI